MDTANKSPVQTKTNLEQFEEVLQKFNWYYDINIDNATWRQSDVLYRQIKEYAVNNGPDYQKVFNKYYCIAFKQYFNIVQPPFAAVGFPDEIESSTTVANLSTK